MPKLISKRWTTCNNKSTVNEFFWSSDFNIDCVTVPTHYIFGPKIDRRLQSSQHSHGKITANQLMMSPSRVPLGLSFRVLQLIRSWFDAIVSVNPARGAIFWFIVTESLNIFFAFQALSCIWKRFKMFLTLCFSS